MTNVKTILSAVMAICCCSSGGAEEINLYGWGLLNPLIEEHGADFEQRTGVNIELHVVPHPYRDNIDLELVYNASVHALGVFSTSTARLSQAGWIQDLSDDPRMVEAANRHYKHLRSAIYSGGKLRGLGAATAVYALPVIDMEMYAELGLSRADFPKDWDALYDQVDSLASAGHKEFFLPAWFNGKFGLPMCFIAEVLNRGGQLVDPVTKSALLSVDSGPVYEVLVDWRRAWNSGAIPKDVLELDYTGNRLKYTNGQFAIGVQGVDSLLQNTHLNPGVGRLISPVPVHQQPWGTAIVGLFSQALREDLSEQKNQSIRDLLYWINQGFEGNKYGVASSFLDFYGYFPVNKEFMQSEQAKSILAEKLFFADDVDVIIDIYENTSVPGEFWQTQWQEEFVAELLLTLKDYLVTPSMSPSAAITRLNKKIVSLRQSYGY